MEEIDYVEKRYQYSSKNSHKFPKEEQIVFEIIDELSGRSGFEFDIDDEVMNEMLETLVAIVKKRL